MGTRAVEVPDRVGGRLLEVRIIGGESSAKNIDVEAVAMGNELLMAEVTSVELGYGPPLPTVWHPVQITARKVIRLV